MAYSLFAFQTLGANREISAAKDMRLGRIERGVCAPRLTRRPRLRSPRGAERRRYGPSHFVRLSKNIRLARARRRSSTKASSRKSCTSPPTLLYNKRTSFVQVFGAAEFWGSTELAPPRGRSWRKSNGFAGRCRKSLVQRDRNRTKFEIVLFRSILYRPYGDFCRVGQTGATSGRPRRRDRNRVGRKGGGQGGTSLSLTLALSPREREGHAGEKFDHFEG